MRVYQNDYMGHGKDIFLYLSARNMLIINNCLADKYKNMSLPFVSCAF